MADNGVSSSSSSGIGFFGLLTIALIVLKLCGVISISWWWIALVFFAPLIIFLAIVIGFLFLSGVVTFGAIFSALGIEYFNERKRRKAFKSRQSHQKFLNNQKDFTTLFDNEPIDVKSKRL